MGHLRSTRIGWENERLAEFLLSRISFIANPAKTSDDVGIDFICTLFRQERKNGCDQLFPTSSFAIQLKTGAPEVLDVSKHLDYLRGLEIPFFLGFVDQSHLALHVYSCHHLPALFSSASTAINELQLVPVPTLNRDDIYQDLKASATPSKDTPRLRVAHVATLKATATLAEIEAGASKLANQCSKTLKDIAAKVSGEHFFHLDEQVFYVSAGGNSVQTFRINLSKRILEAFVNLHWMLKNGQDRNMIEPEFKVYESLYRELKKLGVKEIQNAEVGYEQLLEALR